MSVGPDTPGATQASVKTVTRMLGRDGSGAESHTPRAAGIVPLAVGDKLSKPNGATRRWR